MNGVQFSLLMDVARRFLSWCGVMDALCFAPGSWYIRGMKKILLAALLLTVLATPAFAAKHHHHHHHHHATHPHA
jgi:predicted S18 family serine protease